MQWVSTGSLLGGFIILAKLYIENRRLKLDRSKNEDEHSLKTGAADREGLVGLVGLLRDEVARLSGAHKACETELANQREIGRNQQDQIDGLKRQFLTYQRDVVQRMPEATRTAEIDVALERLDETIAQFDREREARDALEHPPAADVDGDNGPASPPSE